jgi:poly-gamma-glutamate synthesis protein (capsule biosynthesis protein)
LVEKNGFKIALLNYTFSTNGLPVTKPNIVNRIDTATIHKDLIKAKTYRADAIIVFTHWGIEYQSLPSSEQKRITEFCFDLGADLVIGAHPHVIQPMEWRKNNDKLVAYSLGNFVSGQRKRYTDGGAMLGVDLQKISYTSDSTITNIKDAGYMLQWIYKTTDSNKDYYILPVQNFEKDTLGFIKDNASRLALKIFSEDSRSLLTTYNKNIGERTVILSLTKYFVVIAGVDSLGGKYGKEEIITDSNGIKQVLIGPFATKDDATEVVTTLKLIYPDKLFQIIIR